MRRLFAFIVLAISILAFSIANIPSITDNMNQGIEFKGGFEILYQVKDVDGEEFSANEKANATEAAAEVVSSRIDIAGVKNPLIAIEGDDYIRVTIASKNENETSDVRDLITSNAEITFRDVNDKLLATASDLLLENGATLDYNEGSPVVALKIRDTDLWGKITEDISTRTNTSDRRIVIWLGFEEEYKEENDYGFEGDSYSQVNQNPEAANKIISDASVNQAFYSDVVITGSFTDELAAKMANLIKAGTIDFQLEEISVSSIGATYGSEAFNSSLVAGLIGIIAVSILMIGVYGLAGLASAIALILYIVVTLWGFNLLEGEYGPDTIAATVIAIGMAVDANIISFERIKEELYKGKSLRKAFSEGNTKSLSSIIDANATTLIAAISLYLFGTRTVKGFATMLVLSIVFTVIIMVFFARAIVSLLMQSKFFKGKENWFGVKKEDLPDLDKGETRKQFGPFAKIPFMKFAPKISIANGGIIVVGLIFILIFSLATGKGLNLGIQFSEGTKLYFKTADPAYSSVEKVEEIFQNEFNVNADQIVIGNDEIEVSDAMLSIYSNKLDEIGASVDGESLKVYTVSVNFKSQLDNETMDEINDYFMLDKEEYADLYNNGFTLNFVSPIVAAATVKNAMYSLAMACIFIIIYVAWRFKWTYSLASIIALVHDSLMMVAIFAIFRIEVNIEFVSAVLAIIGYSINDTIVLFDRVRENINEMDKKQITHEDRKQIVNSSLQSTTMRAIMTTVSTLLPVIALLIFGSNSSVNFNIAMLVGLVFGTLSSVFIAPFMWLRLEILHDKISAKIKTKKANKVEVISNEPEEYVFYGINDFKK